MRLPFISQLYSTSAANPLLRRPTFTTADRLPSHIIDGGQCSLARRAHDTLPNHVRNSERQNGRPQITLGCPIGGAFSSAHDHDRSPFRKPCGLRRSSRRGLPRLRTNYPDGLPIYEGRGDPLPWLTRCDIFFANQHTPYEERVNIASFHLLGLTQLWFTQLMREHPNPSWADFSAACTLRFGPALQETPPDDLVNLKQLLDWGEEGSRSEVEIVQLRAAFTQEVSVWYKLDHPNVTKLNETVRNHGGALVGHMNPDPVADCSSVGCQVSA
ncbi:hypothetical protein KSP39_PZI024098 [Platanthera zijinensis]|uniref:Retrotransposon gag domain-containing protein n=1 Tax=Platanthera zijinensis TaxID=2320716 RepID=A0AAP0FU34_9ASPA